MKKFTGWVVGILIIALLGYKSVYIQKLSEVKKVNADKFDAVTFSKRLWDERLPAKLDSALSLTTLIQAIQDDPATAFQNYSQAIGISNYRYSLVKAQGKIAAIKEDEMVLQVPHADSLLNVTLATEYVYGNAVRDASGLLDIKDFSNTTDLNDVSEELNKKIRSTVLPDFRRQAKLGDSIEVAGAVEINKEHIRFSGLELIPVRVKLLPK